MWPRFDSENRETRSPIPDDIYCTIQKVATLLWHSVVNNTYIYEPNEDVLYSQSVTILSVLTLLHYISSLGSGLIRHDLK